jgi:hypothetical protein
MASKLNNKWLAVSGIGANCLVIELGN